jgi:multidrug efflux pump subunit AcrB
MNIPTQTTPPASKAHTLSSGFNVSAWSIRNPVPAIMLFVLLSLAGVISFMSMKVQNFPDLDLPTINVSATLPGAAPEQLETEVARKIEDSLASIQGLKHTYTKVQAGGVTITAEFRLEKSTQEALDDVRSAVARVRGDLPADVRDPIVTKLDVAGAPVLAYAISAQGMDDEALSWLVDNTISKQLLAVRGVGGVNRVGGANREVRVAINAEKLQALGATVAEINRSLKQNQVETAAGRSELGGQEQTVRALGLVNSATELGGLSVTLNDGRRLRLDQLATISDTVAEARSAALLNGKPVVGFEIMRSKGASEIEVGNGVKAILDTLKVSHPNVQLTPVFDFVVPIDEEYHGSMASLYEGAILAVLVVFFFLRDWRTTLVSAVALPLSVIPAFIGMHYFGFTLNVVTLLALSLVVGILVDDAIVEVENIVRHLRMGKTPYEAAMEAADEIGLAVVATTFTLVAVFLPTAFMTGIAGKFFKQFGWTASLAIMASLLVARVLTPMMAAYMLKPLVQGEAQDGAIMRAYMRAATWCLKWRWVTMLGAVAFFIGSIFLIPLLPTGFIPADDLSQTQIKLELPPGTPLAETLRVAEQARQLITKVAHIETVYTTIGGGSAGSDPFAPAGFAEVRKATLTLVLSPRNQRSVRKQVIEAQLREAMSHVAGARTTVGLSGSGEKYVLVLASDDPAALSLAAKAVEKDLRTIPNLGAITSSASLVRPELTVRPDTARAAELGVSTSSIGDTLRVATSGDYDVSLPKLNLAQRQVPIMLKLDNHARQNIDILSRITVPSSKPGAPPVMLAQVVDFSMGSSSAEINRYDRSRNVNFDIELSNAPLGDVKNAVAKLPSLVNLPEQVRQREIGDAEVQGELFASFGLAMLTGVLCIYIVLVLLFKDFLQPITILVALPLSLGGAFVALLLAQKAFSMPSLIGLIMLMGIATKNSILLVEYAIMARRDHGLSRWDALLDACHKRARPIVMTTLAMGAGMLPIAMSWGKADGSFKSPMATAVIGGLITSTVLSLLVIPVVFSLVDGMQSWFKRKGWRGKNR